MNQHKIKLKSKWKCRGLIVDNYDRIYDIWINTTNCNTCNTELDINNKCMDHSHSTGKFRGIVCRKCNKNMLDIKHKNNTSGHKNIYRDKKAFVYRKDYYGKRYNKSFKNKIDAICYKFIMLLRFKILKNKY